MTGTDGNLYFPVFSHKSWSLCLSLMSFMHLTSDGVNISSDMPILVPALPTVSRLIVLQHTSIPDAMFVPIYPADAFDTLPNSPM